MAEVVGSGLTVLIGSIYSGSLMDTPDQGGAGLTEGQMKVFLASSFDMTIHTPVDLAELAFVQVSMSTDNSETDPLVNWRDYYSLVNPTVPLQVILNSATAIGVRGFKNIRIRLSTPPAENRVFSLVAHEQLVF